MDPCRERRRTCSTAWHWPPTRPGGSPSSPTPPPARPATSTGSPRASTGASRRRGSWRLPEVEGAGGRIATSPLPHDAREAPRPVFVAERLASEEVPAAALRRDPGSTTRGRLATQFKATWAMLRPTSAATDSSSAAMAKLRSVNFANAGLPDPPTACSRPWPTGPDGERRYLSLACRARPPSRGAATCAPGEQATGASLLASPGEPAARAVAYHPLRSAQRTRRSPRDRSA